MKYKVDILNFDWFQSNLFKLAAEICPKSGQYLCWKHTRVGGNMQKSSQNWAKLKHEKSCLNLYCIFSGQLCESDRFCAKTKWKIWSDRLHLCQVPVLFDSYPLEIMCLMLMWNVLLQSGTKKKIFWYTRTTRNGPQIYQQKRSIDNEHN